MEDPEYEKTKNLGGCARVAIWFVEWFALALQLGVVGFVVWAAYKVLKHLEVI